MINLKNSVNKVAGFGVAALISMASTTVQAGLSEGLVLYQSFCAVCHGAEGEGQAMGKSLVDDGAKSLEPMDLLAVIREGRAGTGMAAWGDSFSAEEILDTANYIRMMQGKLGIIIEPDDPIADDPIALAGRDLFNGSANCISCHTVGEKGGQVGPVLDGLSDRLDAQGILQAVSSPSASIIEGFGVKVIELTDGTTVSGRARNETANTVQIQSADGKRWRTYFKDRVKSISDSDTSLMPNIYAGLSSAQQQQIVAFLNSLANQDQKNQFVLKYRVISYLCVRLSLI